MNVREFRKDLSKHMDSAEKGAEVRVTRGNKVFELKAVGVHGSMVIKDVSNAFVSNTASTEGGNLDEYILVLGDKPTELYLIREKDFKQGA